jgi:ABC-2 type transport system permease protein
MLEGVLTRYMFEGMQDVWTDPERMKEQLDRVRKQVEDSPEELPFEAQIFERFLTAMEELLDHSPPITEDAGVFNALSVRKTEVAFRRDGPRNAYEFTFPQGIIWGLVGCAATFGISLVVERTQGTLTRLCIAPIARWQILAGKSVACFGVTAFLATIMMIIGRLGFGVRVSSVPLLALAVFCACFGFVGIMMSLSTFGRTERSAGGIAWAVMIVLTMLGGGSVPLTFMPAWMQKLSVVSPVRWAVLALEGAIWRGFSPAEMLLPCGILIGVGLVFFALGTQAFRWVHQV